MRREVPVGHPAFGRAFPCPCVLGDPGWRERWTGLPVPLQARTFANFERVRGTAGACAAAERFARGALPWLALCGPLGCGKTHLLAASVSALLDGEAPPRIRYWNVPELLERCKAPGLVDGEPKDFADDGRLTQQAIDVDVLVLDEFLSVHTGDWGRAKLEMIVNARYQAQKPLAIALTGSADKLLEWSPRIQDRFTDAGLAQIVVMTTGSFRPRCRAGVAP